MNDQTHSHKLQQVLEPGGKKLGLTLGQVGTILYDGLGHQADATSRFSKSCVMALEEFDRSELEPVVKEIGLTWDAFIEQVNLGRDSANEVHQFAAQWREWEDQGN